MQISRLKPCQNISVIVHVKLNINQIRLIKLIQIFGPKLLYLLLVR